MCVFVPAEPAERVHRGHGRHGTTLRGWHITLRVSMRVRRTVRHAYASAPTPCSYTASSAGASDRVALDYAASRLRLPLVPSPYSCAAPPLSTRVIASSCERA